MINPRYLFIVGTAAVAVLLLFLPREMSADTISSEEANQILETFAAEIRVLRETQLEAPNHCTGHSRLDEDWLRTKRLQLKSLSVIEAYLSACIEGPGYTYISIAPGTEAMLRFPTEWTNVGELWLTMKDFPTPSGTVQVPYVRIRNDKPAVGFTLRPDGVEIPPPSSLDRFVDAVIDGRLHDARLLLPDIPDIDAVDYWKMTALQYASRYGDEALLNAVLDSGANKDADPGDQGKPLLIAAQYGRAGNVDVLLTRGAKVDVVSGAGNPPLNMAAAIGSTDVIEVLVGHGADVNRSSRIGNTPLHMAAEYCHPAAVSTLIRHDADMGSWNKELKTPLISAISSGCVEAIEVFIGAGANVNAGGFNKPKALTWAVASNDVEIVQLLLKHGAKVSKADIHAAQEWGDDALVDLLEKHR